MIGIVVINNHIEWNWSYFEIVGLLQYCVPRLVGLVEVLPLAIRARPSMVSPDDEMCCAVILSDDAMQQGLSWASHPHR